ncbi:S-adenosylmethionine:tRNA ribosyltransferase-isomerase [Bacillus sp. FSL W7-1360]
MTATVIAATTPVERLGKTRDAVRMLVYGANTNNMWHDSFTSLPQFLRPDDVLVFNNSRTIPARLRLQGGGEVRLSRHVSEQVWDVLIMEDESAAVGKMLTFVGSLTATLLGEGSERPLKQLKFHASALEVVDYLYKYGEVIRYEYVKEPWPLADYQTVYGTMPGSVEMASAGRAFTWRLLASLRAHGVSFATITLHAGLSYYEDDKWPQPSLHPESYTVTKKNAAIMNKAKEAGGRIIAVGTTVVRTLETVAHRGRVCAGAGETTLHVQRPEQFTVIDGLLTGFHEREASHMQLLEAFIGDRGVRAVYDEAIAHNYHWHEFGDMNLLLKDR